MNTCGPIYPSNRSQNADGTWTLAANASCEIPCPNPYSHTYTFKFPSTVVLPDGLTFTFVGSAMAYVQGHHDRIFRAVRLVTVDSATLTDPSSNILPLTKSEVFPFGPQYPTDQWTSAEPLAPDALYTFLVGGTDPDQNETQDVLVIRATYQQMTP